MTKKAITLSLWKFLFCLFLYGLLASVALVFTSAGWTMLRMIYVAGFIYGGVFFISLIVSVVLHRQGVREILISKKMLFGMMIFHLLTLLFNLGDCGDHDGYAIFVQTLLKGHFVCISGDPPFMALLLPILMFMVYLSTLGCLYWKAGNQKKAALKSLTIIYSLVVLLLMGMCGYGLYLEFQREIRDFLNPWALCDGVCDTEPPTDQRYELKQGLGRESFRPI